jgi:hypothetical protein
MNMNCLDPVKEKRKDKIPYEYMKNLFASCNPIEIYKNTGCEYNEEKGEFYVTLMDRKYIVKYPSGEVLREDYSEFYFYPVKTLILRYLVNAKGVPPTGKYISYREVPGAEIYYHNFKGRCILKLARLFGNNLEELEAKFQKLNAEKSSSGDLSYRFKFLNNVYIEFILWKGDEEFPPSANILFDSNVSNYFTAEDLAFVGDLAIGILKGNI